ncbi:hypothetical protein J4209_05760 [Candidatus Woesearchaeota archaeon]|nr:hypothetical protein [Candidatus Woesearchaeota archaeon]
MRYSKPCFKTKGQGLPLNAVIIAILVLVVLVVLIFIFTGQTGKFTKGLDSCPSNNCVDYPNDCVGQIPIAMNCNEDKNLDYCCTAT